MKIKNVQSIIYLVILLLFANHTWAADWIFYDSPSTGKEYYDKNSIKKVNKNIIRVWVKKILTEDQKIEVSPLLKSSKGKEPNNPDLISYVLMLKEIDCVNEKIKGSPMIIYDEDGNVLGSEPKYIDKWRDIAPESVAETLKNIVCSGDKTSKTEKK